jgi:hypothetical protein
MELLVAFESGVPFGLASVEASSAGLTFTGAAGARRLRRRPRVIRETGMYPFAHNVRRWPPQHAP